MSDTPGDAQWAWMMDWCKKRAYPPAQAWAWKYAKKAWKQKEKELAAAIAISTCWYCQLGIGTGRLSLRDVPEPPGWRSTLCKEHLDSIALNPVVGTLVVCEICRLKYQYFIWSFGNNSCLCRSCVKNRPQAHLGDDRLVEGVPDELDHLTNFEKTYEAQGE